MTAHLVGLPPPVALSSTLRRDGAARRDGCGARREAALFPAPAGLEKDAVVGVRGSGFTVMLDLVLSVLEPVMELKREVSSGRGIVTTCGQQSSNPRVGTKRTAGGSVADCHSTEGLGELRAGGVWASWNQIISRGSRRCCLWCFSTLSPMSPSSSAFLRCGGANDDVMALAGPAGISRKVRGGAQAHPASSLHSTVSGRSAGLWACAAQAGCPVLEGPQDRGLAGCAGPDAPTRA